MKSATKAVTVIGSSVSVATSGWILIGTTYLIANLFAFTNLIVLYNYLQFKWVLTPYKKILNEALVLFLSGGDINVILDTIFGVTIQYPSDPNIEEKIQPSITGVDGMYEHGFRWEFLNNSWDELLNVGLLLMKIGIIRLALFIPARLIMRFCKSFLKMGKVYILYEILAGAPTIMIPIGFVLGQFGEMGFRNIESKINIEIATVFPFLMMLSPFLILYCELKN